MIAIGSDHGGYELKEKVKAWLKDQGYEFTDYGCKDKSSCDYPDYGRAVALAVAEGSCQRGIVICTTGIGISITANKVKGIRAALCSDCYSAKMTRLHNNANVLALGSYVVGEGLALNITETFLTTEFSGEERHQRRVDKIERL